MAGERRSKSARGVYPPKNWMSSGRLSSAAAAGDLAMPPSVVGSEGAGTGTATLGGGGVGVKVDSSTGAVAVVRRRLKLPGLAWPLLGGGTLQSQRNTAFA